MQYLPATYQVNSKMDRRCCRSQMGNLEENLCENLKAQGKEPVRKPWFQRYLRCPMRSGLGHEASAVRGRGWAGSPPPAWLGPKGLTLGVWREWVRRFASKLACSTSSHHVSLPDTDQFAGCFSGVARLLLNGRNVQRYRAAVRESRGAQRGSVAR